MLNCRFCQAPLKESFCDLGLSPLANAFLKKEQLKRKEPFYPLHAYRCQRCFLVQLPSLHTPNEIFEEYAYFSSCSKSWLDHAEKFAQRATERFQPKRVVEIASNDGYLLQYFQKLGIDDVLGIEPAKNVAQKAIGKGIPTLVQFFTTALGKKLSKADLVIGNNVLAHVPDLNDFVAGLRLLLAKEGVLVLEFPHLLRLVENSQFDTIYHEHFSYFSFSVVKRIFATHGLEIFEVEELKTHGGSLRIYAQHPGHHPIDPSVERMMESEAHLKESISRFSKKVEKIQSDLLDFLERVKAEGKKLAAYGAPAKGNTLLNSCKVTTREIAFTVDRNPYKQGRFLPGTHIPIYSVEKIAEEKPDYLLILPWNLKEEIMSQMEEMRSWGGRFVVPIPKLEVLS